MKTREEYISICQICQNRAFDLQKGLVCGLSGEHPNFENSCSDYVLDQNEQKLLNTIEKEKDPWEYVHPDAEKGLSVDDTAIFARGSKWFLALFLFSLINAVLAFSGLPFRLFFGLDYPLIFAELITYLVGSSSSYLEFVIDLLFLLPFAGIWALTNFKLSRAAFIIGIVIYSFDFLLALLTFSLLSSLAHTAILFILIRAFWSLLKVQKNTEL